MLDGCTFMFEQFTYNVAKPAAVAKALEAAGFTAEHVRAARTHPHLEASEPPSVTRRLYCRRPVRCPRYG
jgi:hypothetical protein